jgi:spore germination protein YaaH
LKAEYYTVQSNGSLLQLDEFDADTCNGYSPANAAAIIQNSVEQYVTVSCSDGLTNLLTTAHKTAAITTLVEFKNNNRLSLPL